MKWRKWHFPHYRELNSRIFSDFISLSMSVSPFCSSAESRVPPCILFDCSLPSLAWSVTISQSFPVSRDLDILDESWPGIWWWFNITQPRSFPLQKLQRLCCHSRLASSIFVDHWVEMDPLKKVLLSLLRFSLRTSRRNWKLSLFYWALSGLKFSSVVSHSLKPLPRC